MSHGTGLVEVLTAAGTVGAAVVAAVAVVVTGRQGHEQQRLLVAAQERDSVERRADFELGLLMQLSALSRETWRWQVGTTDSEQQARALLLALPPDLLPVLRARVAPLDDTLIRDALQPYKGEGSHVRIQRAIDRELRDAIFARRDVPPVGTRLASRVPWKPWMWFR